MLANNDPPAISRELPTFSAAQDLAK